MCWNCICNSTNLQYPATMGEDVKTWKHGCVVWKVEVWIVEIGKHVIKFLDYIITHLFHQDKSLMHIVWGEYGNLFIHVNFDIKIQGFGWWKERSVFLTQIPFTTFRKCFGLYDELNSWNLFLPSPWPVWLYGLFGLEIFLAGVFLDLKWYEIRNASLQ